MNGQKLETVTSFKYLGSVINNEGSMSEILSRIAQTRAALTRLKPVWNDRTGSGRETERDKEKENSKEAFFPSLSCSNVP